MMMTTTRMDYIYRWGVDAGVAEEFRNLIEKCSMLCFRLLQKRCIRENVRPYTDTG